jgi:hypothetical protein
MAKKKSDSTGEVDKLILPEKDFDTPAASYVPEGFDTLEDYLQDMRETYELDLKFDDDNRIAALEDKKFVAGEQWDPQVLRQRAGLPCLVINTIPQFTAQLVGDWRENKNGIKVLPMENGDKNVADIRSDLIRSIETNNRATRTYDSAFESMIQCGDGAFRIGVKYAAEDVFDQDITIEPIDDVLSVVWDRLSIDPTGRDATHCFVDDVIPQKEFNRRWPESDPSTLSDVERRNLSATGWIDSDTVRVTEHWRIIERDRMLVMFDDGSIRTFDENVEPDEMEKFGTPVKTRVAPCKYAQMHLVTGFKILAGPYEWKMNRLPIIRMAGRTVTMGDRRYRYGLVRFMKDLVRLKNFWRSVAAEQLGYAPKAQWIATESAVEGKEDKIRKAHLTRDPLLVVNDEAIIDQNIKRLDPPPMQMALLNEAQLNTQDMKDVTGIHDASLGIKSNETSGRAIMARQREGDIASLTYYDNGNAAILEAGDVINQLIGQVYDGTRIIRIIGEDEKTKLVKINDPLDPNSPDISLGKYDVTTTSGASYTTRRVEAAEAMMEAIQVYPELMQIAGDLVVKAQDWPGSEELAERLVKTIPPQLLSDKEKAELGDQGPNAQQMMQQQAQLQEAVQQMGQQLQKVEMENAALKTKQDIEMRRLSIEEFKAETDRLAAYAQFAAKDKEFELRQLEHEADQAMAEEELEHQKNVDTGQMLMDAHDQLTSHDQGQQQIDNQAEDAKMRAQNQDTLTQLKIRALSKRLNSDGESQP